MQRLQLRPRLGPRPQDAYDPLAFLGPPLGRASTDRPSPYLSDVIRIHNRQQRPVLRTVKQNHVTDLPENRVHLQSHVGSVLNQDWHYHQPAIPTFNLHPGRHAHLPLTLSPEGEL